MREKTIYIYIKYTNIYIYIYTNIYVYININIHEYNQATRWLLATCWPRELQRDRWFSSSVTQFWSSLLEPALSQGWFKARKWMFDGTPVSLYLSLYIYISLYIYTIIHVDITYLWLSTYNICIYIYIFLFIKPEMAKLIEAVRYIRFDFFSYQAFLGVACFQTKHIINNRELSGWTTQQVRYLSNRPICTTSCGLLGPFSSQHIHHGYLIFCKITQHNNHENAFEILIGFETRFLKSPGREEQWGSWGAWGQLRLGQGRSWRVAGKLRFSGDLSGFARC